MWGKVFGSTHGVILASIFYEHVKRHDVEGRPLRPGEASKDVILEFNPTGFDEMLVACIWSRWQAPGQPDLLSFAAVTDDPPPEILAVGHDRCIVPLRRENVAAWLQPERTNLAAQYAILDDRERRTTSIVWQPEPARMARMNGRAYSGRSGRGRFSGGMARNSAQ